MARRRFAEGLCFLISLALVKKCFVFLFLKMDYSKVGSAVGRAANQRSAGTGAKRALATAISRGSD